MKHIQKYLIIIIIDVILVIPICFGLFMRYLLINEFNFSILLTLIISIIFFIAFNLIIQKYGYNKSTISLMVNHDATAIFLGNRNNLILLLFFPLTMLMEELIFRYYLIGFMDTILHLDVIAIILMSSLIFSVYHLHFWFRFKNVRLTMIFIIGSFIMGIFLSFMLMTLGLIFCVIAHFSLALLIYYNLA
ncbi:MAG: type II CAAX prenyl endopeptidase Rce1 family protein, partial [Candidatus Hermodarchaeota archaeon]